MASVFMTSFDHDHYDIKEETSPRRRQLQQKTVVKSKYQLAKELKAARREQQRLFEDRTLDELVFKASLGHIRPSYYAGWPCQPGIESWFHLAPMRADGSNVRRPKLRANIPDTLLVKQECLIWLRTSPAGTVVTESTKSKKWRKRFHDICCSQPPFPNDSDPIVAVMKVTRPGDPRRCTTTMVTLSELEDRLKAPPEHCIIQRYIKAKGVKPSVYRVVWRPHKPCYALNIVSKHYYKGISTHVGMMGGGGVVEETAGAGAGVGAGAGAGAAAGSSSGALSDLVSKLKPTKPSGKPGQAARELAEYNSVSTDFPKSFTLLKIAGRALDEVEAAMAVVTDYFERLYSSAAGVKLSLTEMAVDFIKDDQDQWWLTHFKSFAVDQESEAALKARVAGNPMEFLDDGADAEDFFGVKKKGKLIKGRQCYFCKLRYLPTEMVAIDGTGREELAMPADIGVGIMTGGHYDLDAMRRAEAEKRAQSPPRHPIARAMGLKKSEEHLLNRSDGKAGTDMIGYTMTRNMMNVAVEALRVRGKGLDCYQHIAKMHASVVYSRYHEYCVCRLCYEVYTAQVELQDTALAFADALGIPLGAEAIICPQKHLSATALQEDLSLGEG